MITAARVRSGHSLSTSDLLHRVRACVKDVRTHARGEDDLDRAIQQRLDNLLRNAMAAQSLSEIAVALGSGAELEVFPDETVLERCTETIRLSGGAALRALIWTVRHRYARHRRRLLGTDRVDMFNSDTAMQKRTYT